ncbi:hypothetical protein EV363DRAFT_1477910 [Boletus edulis]|nr:hypothetical protein EV363DRAFT_1477910 [Boletus edulis]
MLSSKVNSLEGLDENVIPLIPMERNFTITTGNKNKTVVRSQLPVTPAYAFTDYRSQGQTIRHAIIDIAPPPTGALTPFNIYVALSRCRGRENIRLLREFDEKLLTKHPSEYLRMEDERLDKLDKETEKWWNGTKQ